jgi:uncharacterized protein YndB with AHSA1/START domain
VNIVKESDIEASPQMVYDYLLDFTRHSEWTTPGHAVHITADAQGPTVVGSMFTSEAHQFGSQKDRIEVTELVPNRRIVYGVTMKDGNTFRHTLDIEGSGNSTHLRKRFETLNLNLISKLTMPMGWIVAPRMMAGDVERMKARIEHPA